ncbi:disintegrin and metalloproteinase domain-containing protein 28 [Menidia menidia]
MAALLRVLLLWGWVCFSGGEGHQVIRPIRIHSLTKRQAEPGRPSRLDYVFPVGGQKVHLQLTKNTELLTRDYTETFYREDGPITTAPDDIDDCYYHGQVVNDSQSAASISTCDGLRGYIRTAAQRFLIEPLGGGDQGDHALTPVAGGDHAPTPVAGGDPAPTPVAGGATGGPGCAASPTPAGGDDFEPPTGRSRSRAAGASIVQQEKFIQLLLVADNRMYKKMDGDEAALRKRVFEIVNFVNMAYRPLRTFVALVGLEVWSSRDLISVTTSAGENLENFRNWRNSDLMKRKPHDNAHLLSGIDFDGATLGLAYVGTLCSGSSVGVVQDHSNRAIAMAATLAHEMGHNLGMSHDDSSGCTCPAQSCIMEAALSWNAPRSFSSCSSSNYERYQLERSPDCLLDKPDYRSLEGPGVCGNGFLERGEQCDCGTVEECRDPCCNATSCLLVGGAQCSAGECCQDCKVSPPSRECRPRRDACDLPEFCDGRGPECPEDVFAANGLTCSGGFCRDGRCPQRGAQCMQLYGAGATEAPPSCYKQNTRGTNFGYCRRISDVQFVPCQQEDLLCGKLYCQGGNPFTQLRPQR